MKHPTDRVTPFVGCLAALSLITALAGCATITGTVTEEINSAVEDSDVREVLDRFDSMTEIVGDANGDTLIETSQPGTVWALTRRDDARKAHHTACSLDGMPMNEPDEGLNIPEPPDLGADGQSQTLFAFAASEVDVPGSYAVACDLDAPVLLFLFEPTD